MWINTSYTRSLQKIHVSLCNRFSYAALAVRITNAEVVVGGPLFEALENEQ